MPVDSPISSWLKARFGFCSSVGPSPDLNMVFAPMPAPAISMVTKTASSHFLEANTAYEHHGEAYGGDKYGICQSVKKQ